MPQGRPPKERRRGIACRTRRAIGGAMRAAYGEAELVELSRHVTAEFGRALTATNLRYMRQFYLAFPIHHALRDESESTEKWNALRSVSPGSSVRASVRLESGVVPVAPALR